MRSLCAIAAFLAYFPGFIPNRDWILKISV